VNKLTEIENHFLISTMTEIAILEQAVELKNNLEQEKCSSATLNKDCTKLNGNSLSRIELIGFMEMYASVLQMIIASENPALFCACASFSLRIRGLVMH
jgi:hypothetical protein